MVAAQRTYNLGHMFTHGDAVTTGRESSDIFMLVSIVERQE